MNEYTTVKVPKKLRRSIDLIRAEIIKEGKIDNRLLTYLKEDTCPFCGIKLVDAGELKVRYAKLKECPNCGFSKPVIVSESKIKIEDLLTILGVGLLVGLGIFLIAEILKSCSADRKG